MGVQKPKVLWRAAVKGETFKNQHQFVATQCRKHVTAHAVATNCCYTSLRD